MNNIPETGTILFEVALLTVVVLLVDEWAIRGALAFIPAMLLAQRALDAGSSKAPEKSTASVEEGDQPAVRAAITRVLEYLRQFYATCHLAGSGGITPEEAMVRTNNLERDLSRLLREVTEGPREVAVRSAREPEPLPTL